MLTRFDVAMTALVALATFGIFVGVVYAFSHGVVALVDVIKH